MTIEVGDVVKVVKGYGVIKEGEHGRVVEIVEGRIARVRFGGRVLPFLFRDLSVYMKLHWTTSIR